MSIILSCAGLKKAYGARPLFDGLDLGIEAGERIGLIGPNGSGKSTLLRIFAGVDSPDDGNIALQKGLRIGLLEQIPAFKEGATVEESILEGIEGESDYAHLARVQEYMSRLSLDGRSGIGGETPVANLSGGWKKRVAIARLLVGDHDLLLLDEPTNHLDLESILWLEDLLADSDFATVTVTHDRLFLQRVSDRIWELDRRNKGGLLVVDGTYADYLERKEALMAGQERDELVLKNILRRETAWLRRGARARTTKQQARIKQVEAIKKEVEDIESRNVVWTPRLDFQASEKNPKKLIEAIGISKSYGKEPLFKDVDLLITPGSRLGLLGPNGCGKTTLIKVLVGAIPTDSGEVKISDQLKVIYFEQNREALDPNMTVAQTVSPSGDHVKYRGDYIHIRSYLDRFNFSQEKMNMEVGRLSGGEQSRLLIARLLLNEANVLVLDEPTNDLDMSTLEVLERCLLEFPGAVILVTHDRYFLDQVANKLLAFGEPDGPNAGKVVSFASLGQWERAYLAERSIKKSPPSPATRKEEKVPKGADAKRKLSFKEQFEFDHIEERIHSAEEALEKLRAEVALPEVASDAKRLAELVPQMEELEKEIDRLYGRWSYLSSIV